MALTKELIENSNSHIDDVSLNLWVTLIRQCDLYRANAAIFSVDVAARITATEGTTKARMLNALMGLISKLGPGEIELRGADIDKVWYSQKKERDALVAEAFLVLFDDITESQSTTSGVIPSAGIYGVGAVGTRPYYCNLCGTYYSLGQACNCSCKIY